MQKTQNYNLNQWETSDPICRADFNSDNAAIDAALGAQAAAIATKANQTDLAATNAALSTTNATVAKKADQTAVDAVNTALAAKADLSALNALTAALGSGGQTCRVAYGTYTGTGTSGASAPTSLSFEFIPVLVIVAVSSYFIVMTRGCTSSDGMVSGSNTVVWGSNGVSWYNASSSNSEKYQANTSGNTYYWAALGV